MARQQVHSADISFQDKPEQSYTDTKANIEALSSPVGGMSAYASDTNEKGFYNGTIWVWGAGGSADLSTHSVDELLDVNSSAPSRDQVLKWNGTAWVPAAYNATFAMTISAFDDGQSSPQLIGSGVWKAIAALAFTATYDNPPPASASINVSGTGVSWVSPLTLVTPFTSGASEVATNYPSSKDVTVTFTLTAYDGATPRTATCTVTFYNNVFYGPSTTSSGFTEAQVEALTAAITNAYTASRAINAGASNYLVLAYPASYTSIHANGFIFNGVTCPFQAAETVSITNSAGYTENYKVFVSVNPNLGNSTLQLSTSASLIDPIYYGVSTKVSTFLESDVEGLASNVISNTKGRTISLTSGVNDYLMYCLPTRLGTVTFTVGGFEGGFNSPETVSVTNANGYTEDYYVYRSANKNLGTVSVVVS